MSASKDMHYNIIVVLLTIYFDFIYGQTYSLSGSTPYGIRGAGYRFTCQISVGNIPAAAAFRRDEVSVCRILLSACQQSSSDARYACGCINGNNRTLYLNITGVESADGGEWTCRDLDISGGGSSLPVTLLVYYGPENNSFTPTGSSITVIENESISVRCSADCNPPCNISWYKGSTIISSTGLLSLNNIQRQEAGNYTCQTQHKNITNNKLSKVLQLTVHYGPDNIRFTPTSSSRTVIENESRSVTCSADCNPLPCNINWYKGSAIISSTELLSLYNIKRQQADNYTCQVTNTQISGSFLSKQLTVIVNYPPSISSLKSDATNNMINEDSSITLTCSVDSLPSSNISWSRSQQGRQLYFGRQYTVSKADCQHTDNYTCTASNGIGELVSKTTPLYVRCRPVLDLNKDTKTSISVSRGETGVLSIHVLAYPQPGFTWYYQQDGTERLVIDFRSQQIDDGLSSTLTIQDVTFDDSRKYIVYVNNSLGTRSIVFNVDVLSGDDDDNDAPGSNNNLLGVGIAVGLGIILFIFAMIVVLLCIIFKRTGRRLCIQKVTGNDQTVFDDAHTQANRSDNITLSETPPIYDRVDTDAVNTRDPSNSDYINSDTSRSPYEVLDKQTTDQQPNSYEPLDTPSTYELLDKQTTDQQPNNYQQLSPYQNVT